MATSINLHSPFLPFFFFFFLTTFHFSIATTTLTSLCNHQLPLPQPTLPSPSFPSSFFTISSGSFSGGHPLFSSSPPLTLPNSFSFLTKSSFHTTDPYLIRVAGTLILRGSPPVSSNRSLLHLVKPRIPRHRPFVRHASVSFDLDGFWSESDSVLCMSGAGIVLSEQGNSIHPNSIFKLGFAKSSNLSRPFVTGSLESMDESSSPDYFDPISLVSFAEKNYEYTQVEKAEKFCGGLSINEKSRGLDGNFSCESLRRMLEGGFRLKYGENCLNGFCDPLRGDLELDQDFMFLDQIDCSDDGKVHMYMLFTNQTRSIYRNFVIGEKALVGEGLWDGERNKLCLLGCDVLVSEESSRKILSIGECNFRISFWFPLTWSLKTRSVVVGKVWREKIEGKTVNSSAISFASTGNYRSNFGGLKYDYAKLDIVRGLCAKVEKKGEEIYPDGKSYRDMRFQFNVKNKEGMGNFGIASPISIGENFYGAVDLENNSTNLESKDGYFNITYKIQYNSLFSNLKISNEKIEISAEGIYDSKTGTLCLVGCRYVGSLEIAKKARVNDSFDCEIFVNLQFGPLNGKAKEHVKGTIKSLRKNSDHLFFNQLDISSYGIYVEQASESIFRMDIEIGMVLASLTLTCVFLGLQLYHVKKNPNFLPYISILMLVVLALGDMIPLVLNFDALFFMRRSKQNVLLWSGGWLEVNEVIIRVLTMVNFLLQLRLLQVVWSARSNEESKTGYWTFEKKTLIICFPLYLFGALIAWIFHTKNNRAQHTIWEDLISYAGLILDGFLIPQVIFNIFSDLKEKTLSHSFYLGFTLVRALPHAYDLYRAHHYVPYVKSSFIYASPNDDIYTLAWDIIVILGGFILSMLVFWQQKYGGASFLPLSMRKTGEYEMVPVSSSS
ncbi:hypothetical protein LUZ60_008059 [Juncus effusus]|nr:hypothetical protein LUZ60_008059 [Juncus effusus]